MADYVSPGAAFTNTIEDALLQKRLLARQDMLDKASMDQKNEEMRMRREEGEARRADILERATERDRTDFEKRVGNMLPGDVADPEMQAKDIKFGTHFFTTPPPVEAPGPVEPGKPPVTAQGPTQFIGTAAQRTAAQTKTELQTARDKVFADGGDLSNPATRKALAEYESIPGAPKISPELLKQPKSAVDNTEAVIRQNPRTGVVEQYQPDGTWTKLAGNPPKGAHWITEPPPNTDAANQRKENRVQSARQFYLGKMTDRAKTVNTQLDALDAMDTALTAAQSGNHQAEGLAVIELMKATVAGAGVRLTQPEIDMEMAKARTTWQSLQLTANKWTGKGPLQITAEQAEGLRNLHKKLLEKAEAAHDRLVKGQRDIVNADTIEKVNEAGVDAEENRHPKTDSSDAGPKKPAYTGSPADIYKNLFTSGAK